MIRPVTSAWLISVVVLGVALYQIKHEVQTKEDRLAALNRTILADQEALHVLKAEWSYLSQPERIAELSEKYLSLHPISHAAMRRIEDLPPRAADPEDAVKKGDLP